MALKDIKSKIAATNRMHKVTRAMEAVSAVKMRKTQLAALSGRPYARAALQILARLSGSEELLKHPLSLERASVRKVALVVITSDRGLAGALNSGLIKVAAEAVAMHPKESVVVYAYGKKGNEYFARRGFAIARSYENKTDEVDRTVMDELSAELAEGFVSERYDEVYVVYNNFRSTFEHVPTVRRLLPLSLSVLQQLVADIAPEHGKFSDLHALDPVPAYEIEPAGEEVLGILVPRLVSVALYHMLLESKAAEHSARMVAMKNASDKSKEVAADLTHEYNKVRQAAITREVSEIVGGREALAA